MIVSVADAAAQWDRGRAFPSRPELGLVGEEAVIHTVEQHPMEHTIIVPGKDYNEEQCAFRCQVSGLRSQYGNFSMLSVYTCESLHWNMNYIVRHARSHRTRSDASSSPRPPPQVHRGTSCLPPTTLHRRSTTPKRVRERESKRARENESERVRVREQERKLVDLEHGAQGELRCQVSAYAVKNGMSHCTPNDATTAYLLH